MPFGVGVGSIWGPSRGPSWARSGVRVAAWGPWQGWQLFSSASCSADAPSSTTWTASRVFNSAGAVPVPGLPSGGACAGAVRSAPASLWVGVEFGSEESVRCMAVTQSQSAAAHELRLGTSGGRDVGRFNSGLRRGCPLHRRLQKRHLVYPCCCFVGASHGLLGFVICGLRGLPWEGFRKQNSGKKQVPPARGFRPETCSCLPPGAPRAPRDRTASCVGPRATRAWKIRNFAFVFRNLSRGNPHSKKTKV